MITPAAKRPTARSADLLIGSKETVLATGRSGDRRSGYAATKIRVFKQALIPGLRLGAMLGLILALCLPAAAEEGKFLFLTLRFKDGVITVVKSALVSGTLKPQRDSTKADALHITLETGEGKTAWSVARDDPSVRRYEYEDPQQPGVIRSKEVKVNDTEFIVRTPLVAGVRHLAVYRYEPPAPGAKQSAAPVKKLLVRHTLSQEVTQ